MPMTADEQLFSSPGSVQEEFTKESFKERIMFFETKKVQEAGCTVASIDGVCSASSRLCGTDRHQQWKDTAKTDAMSEDEAPFASSELETLSESLESLFSAVEEDASQASLEDVGRAAADQRVDDIETTPLEKLAHQECLPGELDSGVRSACQLPSSFELVNNFRKSKTRPTFLGCPSALEAVRRLSSRNLYACNEMVFSNTHLSSLKSEFRAPGPALSERPRLHLSNSIVSESGILYYIRVSSAASSWYLLKSLESPELDLISIAKNDRKLSMFVTSDVVTTRFKRSNYLMLNGVVAVGRFIGQSLCICVNGRCIKALKAKHVEKKDETKILIDGFELELSCETERNEWVESVRKLNLC